MSKYRKNICLDFDGVTHSYTSDWEGADIASDPPIEGAIAWIRATLKHYDVTIYSARLNDPKGKVCIEDYLFLHGMYTHEIKLLKWHAKPHAHLYIDDRAFHFKGTFPTLPELRAFKPWNR